MDKDQYMLAIKAIKTYRNCTSQEAISILELDQSTIDNGAIDYAFRAGFRDGRASALSEVSIELHDWFIEAQKHADSNRNN